MGVVVRLKNADSDNGGANRTPGNRAGVATARTGVRSANSSVCRSASG